MCSSTRCVHRKKKCPGVGQDAVSVPLVEGTPTTRESIATASRRERATDLNCASTTWWALRPLRTLTCSVIWLVATIDSQIWRVRVVS